MVWVDRQKQWKRVADAIALFHFLFVNAIMILGFTTDLFKEYGGKYPGMTFVFQFVDAPVYSIGSIQRLADHYISNLVASIAIAEFVFILSSALYAGIAYIILSILSYLFID